MIISGVVVLAVAASLAGTGVLERSGIVDRMIGWMVLRSFIERAVDVLVTTPMLVVLGLVGVTLVIAGTVSRR